MTAINRFHKAIICLLFISFICVFMGSMDIIRSQTIGVSNNPNLNILVGFAICLICFLFAWKCFRWLDNLTEKGCLLLSLIVLMLICVVFIAVSFCARVSQYVDSIDVLDTAFYLRNHLEASEELPYIKYVGSFGNNYPVILFESFLIKILDGIGVQDIDISLNHLNIVVLMAAVILTWLIVKESRGVKSATKTALLCLLNPYLYLLVNWTYSMTYSLPIMMAILYVALLLKKTKTVSRGIVLAFAEGLLMGGGFLIRPTTVFPLIAALIVWLPSFVKKKIRINKRRMIQLFCVLFTALLVVMFVNVQVDRRFGKIKSQNMPLSFWTMMGSHGDGRWNEADLDALIAVQNPEDRAKFALNQTISNYTALGVDGIMSLWYNKLITAWANGGFFYSAPAVSDGNSLSDYIVGSGARNQLTRSYSQAFRLFMIMGFLLACIAVVIRRNVPEIVLIMMITIFGCVAFHSIWETNARYSIPFILPMLVVVAYAISSMQHFEERKALLQRIPQRTVKLILMVFLAIVCFNLSAALKEEKNLHFNRIYSSNDTRVCAEIEPNGFMRLEQDFYTDKSFNTLFFKTALPKEKAKSECSQYELSIMNDEGNVLNKTYLSPDKIGKNGIVVSFDVISGYTHYFVRLEKLDPEKESILFYTHYTYGVDPYRGTLKVDDGKAYPSDLMMDAYETKATTMLSDKGRIAIIFLIMLLGTFIVLAPVRNKKSFSVSDNLV